MKTEAEISYVWQLAHLKFHFGEKLAMRSMHLVVDPAMKSVIPSPKNEFRLGPLHPEFPDAQAGNAGLGEEALEVGAGDRDLPEQSRKEPAAGAPNRSTRIA